MTIVLEDDKLYVELTSEPLSLSKYVDFVSDAGAGGTSTFSGTTRDNFNGQRVLRLEYEAYGPMAVSEMKKICLKALEQWPLIRVAIAHRTGEVAVKEASVIIVASAAHRKESLQAVAWAIDELKATVPIWKKEWYEDGSVWKENAESRRLQQLNNSQA